MAGYFQTIAGLWLSRMLLLIAAALVVAGVAFLPTGVVQVERQVRSTTDSIGTLRTEPMQHFIIQPDGGAAADQGRAVWSLSQYAEALGEYAKQLSSGELKVRNWYGARLFGQEAPVEPLLPILRSISLTSVTLLAQALGVGLLLGVPLGVLILGRRGARALSVGLSVAGMALPDFLLVILCQLATIFTFKHFGFRLWSVLGPEGGERGWLMPLVALSMVPMAYTARLVATALDEVMREEFIKTARSKGLTELRVVVKHAMRNALPRVLNGVPAMLNVTLSSLLVVEVLTNVNGLGAGLMRGISGLAPHVVATVGLVFCLWFTLMDGLANSLRVLANPQLRGGVQG